MDVSGDGGSSPRPRRGLSDSMIAGRRRPGEAPRAATRSEPGAPPAGGDDLPKPTVRRRRPAAAAEAPAEPAPSATSAPALSAAPPRVRTPRAPRRRLAAPEAGGDESEAPRGRGARAVVEAAPIAPEVIFAPAPELPPLPAADPVSADPSSMAVELGRVRSLVEQQRMVLAELRAGMLTLGQQVDRGGYRPRLGVFVDVPNLMYGVESGRPVHMGRLLNMLREGRELVRATAYSPISDDPREPVEQQKFVAPFVPYDYRIVTKPLKRFADGSIKGNFDVEMAIDMVSMADRVDVIVIVSGDADFARAVEAVQNRGVRVEVAAFSGSTSLEMRALADHYLELGTVAERIT